MRPRGPLALLAIRAMLGTRAVTLVASRRPAADPIAALRRPFFARPIRRGRLLGSRDRIGARRSAGSRATIVPPPSVFLPGALTLRVGTLARMSGSLLAPNFDQLGLRRARLGLRRRCLLHLLSQAGRCRCRLNARDGRRFARGLAFGRLGLGEWPARRLHNGGLGGRRRRRDRRGFGACRGDALQGLGSGRRRGCRFRIRHDAGEEGLVIAGRRGRSVLGRRTRVGARFRCCRCRLGLRFRLGRHRERHRYGGAGTLRRHIAEGGQDRREVLAGAARE